MNTFTYNSTSVTIAKSASRPLALPLAMSQMDGIDSAGDQYVYSRTTVSRSLALTFNRVTLTEMANVNTFITGTIKGNRHRFTWNDGTTTRTLRYGSHTWQQITPSYCKLVMNVLETL